MPRRVPGSRWLAFTFIACGGAPAKTSPVDASPPASVPLADVVTLRALHDGDRACYVVFETASGQEKTQEAAFELCEGASNDATPLVGQRVRFTTKRQKVLAMECQGDPDCRKSDEVDLIIAIAPAR